MNIAIIDADLIGRSKHRFPNLACLKLSGYYKDLDNDVILKTDYEGLQNYDKVFISKVFTDTPVIDGVLRLPNVECGGTGFYYDKAPALPHDIEHHMPDYHLYDDWVQKKLNDGGKKTDFKYYIDYSIGFMTRGCFRKCAFCVNQNYNKVDVHSPLDEFVDPSRKKICLLDDNVLGNQGWKNIFSSLQDTGRPFQFKQGIDERLLTEEKCKALFGSKYDGDFIFAFDNIEDKEIIEEKARMIRRYNKNTGNNIKFYVLCAFDRNGVWDESFWIQDIRDLFERVFILAKYNFKPYVMRYERYNGSPLYGSYVNIARWCNQPSLFNNLSFADFCKKDDMCKSGGKGTSSTWRYYEQLKRLDAECADRYFNTAPKTLRLDYSNW